jgi:hypothetical protein
VSGDGKTLTFELSVRGVGPGPFAVTVRVRDNPQAPPDQVFIRTVQLVPGERQRLTIPAPPGSGPRFQYQVGARRGSDSPAFFSRWQSSSRVGG